MSKAAKNIVIVVVVIAVIAYVYINFIASPTVDAPTSGLATSTGAPVSSVVDQTVPSSNIEASRISQEFVSQLLNLQAIKLNDDIFASRAFNNLEDFTKDLIQPGNEGRPNPFAPFGIDESNIDNFEGLLDEEGNIIDPFNVGVGDLIFTGGVDPNATGLDTPLNDPFGAGFFDPGAPVILNPPIEEEPSAEDLLNSLNNS